jgi:hypothetical protein
MLSIARITLQESILNGAEEGLFLEVPGDRADQQLEVFLIGPGRLTWT